MPITPLPPADYEPEYSGANYSQNMGQYNRPGTFRFWCQKVLPLVYDDSLSYYELLCKVVDYLNKTMEDVNTAAQDVDDLNNSFNSLQQYTNTTFDEFKSVYDELQTYVNTYFSGLDVQEEINNKLDTLASDGTLSSLISPLLPNLIADWLSNNLTPTTPPIDKTLTISNAAADAKITGDLIRQNSGGIDNLLKNMKTESLTLVSGGITENGAQTDNTTRIRTQSTTSVNIQSGDFIYCNPLYELKVLIYELPPINSTNYITTLNNNEWRSNSIAIPEEYAGKYSVILIRKIGHETDDISADVATITNYIKYYRSNSPVVYRGNLSDFGYTSFSDVEENGVYVFSNLFAWNAADAPDGIKRNSTGVNGLLKVFNSGSYRYQIITQFEYAGAVYMRSKLLSNTDYNPWRNTFKIDFDSQYRYTTLAEYLDFGAYVFGSTSFAAKTDAPVTDTAATLIVYPYISSSGTGATQMVITTDNQIFTRFKTGSGNFNAWIKVANELSLEGKTVAIITDSIGTHGNSGNLCNAYELEITADDVGVTLNGYPTYEDVHNNLVIGNHTFTNEEIGTQVEFTPTAEDVGKKLGMARNYNPNSLKVWWTYLKDAFNCNLIPVAYSGSTITQNRDSTNTLKGAYAFHPSQIRKCGTRTPGTMTRTAPDYIIIARGINDFTHEPYAVLTDGFFDVVNRTTPETGMSGTDYGFLESYTKTITELRTAYPNAKIILTTLQHCNRVNYEGLPVINNGVNNLGQYNEAIKKLANIYNCGVMDMGTAIFNPENIASYSSDGTHLNAEGHRIWGEKAIQEFVKNIH